MKLAVGFAASLWISCVQPFVPHNFLSRAVFVGSLYSVVWDTFRGILCQLLWLWRFSGCGQPKKFCTARNWCWLTFFLLSSRFSRCRLDTLTLFLKDIDATPTVRAWLVKVPQVGLLSFCVVKVLMAENHFPVTADTTVCIFSASTDRARITLR